jgi:peptide/nickel transport system permease protein
MALPATPEMLEAKAPRRGAGARHLVRMLTTSPKAKAGAAILLFFILLALLAPVLSPGDPTAMQYTPLQPPSWAHWLGTTDQGQDVLAQMIWGAQTSLEVGFLAGALTTALSVVIGMVSGFVGGWLDELLQMITNVFLVIPSLPLMIVLAAYIPFRGEGPIIFVITITGWAWGARVLRAQTLALRKVDYVHSARLAGEPVISTVLREILPNMLSLVVANFLFTVLYAILSEASLEFLGLGNVNVVSWGTILYWADNDQALLTGAWWWIVPPGLAIALVGAGLALLNYAVDEITNPRLRQGSGAAA